MNTKVPERPISRIESLTVTDDLGVCILHPIERSQDMNLEAEYALKESGFTELCSWVIDSVIFFHGLNGGRKHIWTDPRA
jgi:hypothetical protein